LERKGQCRCIRCREVGLRRVTDIDVVLKHVKYEACGGEEHFVSFESKDDSLVGFLRLRLGPGSKARVRELHVYGPLVPIGAKNDGWQHRGYGARLVKAAEVISLEKGYKSLEITSGIGARGYYRELGYELSGPYMAKILK